MEVGEEVLVSLDEKIIYENIIGFVSASDQDKIRHVEQFSKTYINDISRLS